MKAFHVTLSGRVQGVGFRWHARLEARALGIHGWVRNLENGDVEAHAEGEAPELGELLEWLRKGPSGARVEDCQVKPLPPGGFQGFEIR